MNRAVHAIRNVLVAMMSLCACEIASASAVITISPLNPGTTDIVHINVSTEVGWCFPPPTPPYGHSTTISGQTIQVLLTIPACLSGVPPPPYVYTSDVGPLPPGIYQVQSSIRDYIEAYREIPAHFTDPLQNANISFVVIAVPPPESIPVLDSRSAVVLITLLAFLAALRIRRA